MQPRRRDFTGSSQGLPDLTSALLATHSVESSVNCPILSRDPSSALPHPHQRPATAATCPPSGFSPTSGLGPGTLPLAAGFSHTSGRGFEAATAAGSYHPPGHTFVPVTMASRHHGWEQPVNQAAAPHCLTADWWDARSEPGQAAARPSNDEQPAYHVVGPSQPASRQWRASTVPDAGPSLHTSRHRAATAVSDMGQGWSGVRQGSIPVEQVYAGMRHPVAGMQQAVPQLELQPQHRAGHGAAASIPGAQYQTLLLDNAEELSHVGQHGWQSQPHSQQHSPHQTAGSCFDWSGCYQGSEQQAPAPVLKVPRAHAGPHRHAFASTPDVVLEHKQQADAPDRPYVGTRQKQQGPVDAEIEAMETVLSDYKALRAQIAHAEAQLASLQSTITQADSFQGCKVSGHHDSSQNGAVYNEGHQGSAYAGGSHVSRHLAEVTNTLRQLRAAAAKQRPAVEVVASQLRDTLAKISQLE